MFHKNCCQKQGNQFLTACQMISRYVESQQVETLRIFLFVDIKTLNTELESCNKSFLICVERWNLFLSLNNLCLHVVYIFISMTMFAR